MERAGRYLTSIGALVLLGAVGIWFWFYLQLRNAIPVSLEAALPCLFATSKDCLAGLQLTGTTTSPLAFWAGAFVFWVGGCLWGIGFVEHDRLTFGQR